MTVLLDPAFPQIGRLLDSGYMRVALETALFAGASPEPARLKIVECRIGEKRHKPGKSFRLSYELTLEDEKTGRRREQIVSAEANAEAQGWIGPNAPPSLQKIMPSAYLPDLDTAFWAFPHDRKLKHLAELHDAKCVLAYFSRHRRHLNLTVADRIENIAFKVMHYLPMRSCMTRYHLSIADQSCTSLNRKRVIYGKTYADESGQSVFSVMKQLAGQSENCARPLFYDSGLKTLWQAHAEGVPFTWQHLRSAGSNALLQAVAQAIVKFHGSCIRTAKRYGIQQITAQLDSCCKIAESANPDVADEVRVAVRALKTSSERINWNAVTEAPIHMDMKMGNLLISGEKITLIDLDEVCLGDPLADFGSFIANIHLNGLCAGAEPAEIGAVAETLIREYSAAMPGIFDQIRFNWHLSAAFIHEVLRRSLRQQNELRLRHLGKYLELSRRYCPAAPHRAVVKYG